MRAVVQRVIAASIRVDGEALLSGPECRMAGGEDGLPHGFRQAEFIMGICRLDDD